MTGTHSSSQINRPPAPSPALPPLVLGISGASASGKSTISDALSHICPRSTIIRQDAFYKPETELPLHPVFERNWDLPDSFRNEDLVNELEKLKELGFENWGKNDTVDPTLNLHDRSLEIEQLSKRIKATHSGVLNRLSTKDIIIVEGICLISSPEIVEHLDIRVWLRAPENVLRKRREARSGYLTGEGTVFVDPPGYWEGIVWPSYLESHGFLETKEVRERLRLIEHDSHERSIADILVSILEHLDSVTRNV